MQKFIELLESELGYSEKSGGYTKFGDWYGKTVEFDADYSGAPWCDMYLSWAAKKLGYEDWIGQFAYTVYHAEWFRDQDAWGTTPKPGAIVFFDWGGSREIDNIDHVGIVTKVDGGTIHTIEGNIDGGVAKRKERDTGKVVGYGYPEKIKARLDEEAAEQQEVSASTATSTAPDNFVALLPRPDLLSILTTPTLVDGQADAEQESASGATTAATGEETAKAPGTETSGAKSTRAESTEAVSAKGTGTAPATASGPETGESAAATGTSSSSGTTSAATARPQVSAGRPATGKHAKPTTADTASFTATPTAVSADLATTATDLSTPAMIGPVLIAAAAIIAHAKAKQSGLRLAFAGGARGAKGAEDAARPSPRTAGSHRSGGRRAPGRRRATRNTSRNTSVLLTALTAPELVDAGSAVTETSVTRESHASQSTSLTRESFATESFSLTGEDVAPRKPLSAPEALITSGLSTARELPASPEPFLREGASAVQSLPAERPRLPYQGRRRIRERPVVESSTFTQDAPLRGRRHRRSESTTFVQDAPLRGRRHRRTEPAVSTTIPSAPVPAPSPPASSRPTTSVDLPALGDYRGRRRREAVPAQAR
ncbi:CHAP domain-containing protein [Planobispora longispora]|nr:CHAP domain-containing protein [Planobispora longispora]